MKRRLLHVLTAMTVVLAGSMVAPAPASASDAWGIVCNLKQNTWLRAAPQSGFVLRTLTAGRGFRWHGQVWALDDDVWLYGHGAEDPSLDGWVPGGNTTC
ncbi:hypothetical protein [Micromonospora cathayae]|uniref:SH3 domain-containing protein n=1 Tax=Micromonospora cathayae TaxID=3028804 RepID=A0ABY7ZRY2_9ACTN|nr:hypothetical protein [Micromonospora sp. HUAS 3]WDZ85792.1 hypothetical protein PVK37_04960 [Micromonospora sp. HUAS 3]